jgi:hypothetical protein
MGKGVLAVAAIIVVVLAGFAGWYIFMHDGDGDGVPDNQDAFPNDTSESRDTDKDGVGDNADAFPNDPNETSDFDDDGIGDNSDPDDDNDSMPDTWETSNNLNPKYAADGTRDEDNDQLVNAQEYSKRSDPRDPDTDVDSVIDGLDIDPAVDTIVVFQYTRFKVEDPIDIGTEGDVYFMISMNDEADLTSSVILYDTNAADVPADFTAVFNVADNVDTVYFRSTWFDRDFMFDDKLDVSGIGTALDVNYSLNNHAWWGDDSDGVVSGNDDGSTTWDEDDITVWYQIYDSVAHPDQIESILASMGSESGTEDFNQAVRAMGHVILEQLVQWALDHPDFFAEYGSWGALIAAGLQVLAIVVKFYRLFFLQNDDK